MSRCVQTFDGSCTSGKKSQHLLNIGCVNYTVSSVLWSCCYAVKTEQQLNLTAAKKQEEALD
jgi:hypothetical protein